MSRAETKSWSHPRIESVSSYSLQNSQLQYSLEYEVGQNNMPAPDTATTDTAKNGLDVLFAAIDYQQSSDETSSYTPSSPNPKPPVSFNPFRSKMDPRMTKSIEAKAINPNMLDEEAVMAGFAFPERGINADANWFGEGDVSMRQRKINFRRSWKRFLCRQNKNEDSTEMALSIPLPGSVTVIPSSPISVHAATTVSSSDGTNYEDSSSIESAPAALNNHLSTHNSSIIINPLPMTLPKKRSAGSLPQTLLSIISIPEFEHIISWLPSGEAFCVHKREEFESQILPKYFGHARFDSFVRKLNRWGFRRMNKNSAGDSCHFAPRWIEDYGSIIFYHEDFKRDDPDRMLKIALSNNTSEFRKVFMDSSAKKAMSNEALRQALSAPTMTTTLRPGISIGPEDFILPHGLAVTRPPELVMMQHQVDLNILLIQRQQQLYYMSQKTNHSRSLLHAMKW
jgi:hypothetical protein